VISKLAALEGLAGNTNLTLSKNKTFGLDYFFTPTIASKLTTAKKAVPDTPKCVSGSIKPNKTPWRLFLQSFANSFTDFKWTVVNMEEYVCLMVFIRRSN